MVKYRNPKHEEENLEIEELEKIEEVYKEPAKNVEEEVWKNRAREKDRYITQLRDQAKRDREELERKLDQALRGQIKPPKSKEEVGQWRQEYPEFSNILQTIIQDEIKEATQKTNETLETLKIERHELELDKALQRLKKLHPDFVELSNSDDFKDWLSARPKRDQDALYKGADVDAADLVLTKYKAEKGKLKSKVDDEFTTRDTAKVVRTPAKASEPVEDFGDYEFSESQIERESKKNRRWFEQNEEKILSAARRGKLLYDISGGAR